MASRLEKRRELLPELNALISKCVGMGADVAKLEISNNEQAIKRARRILMDMKNKDIPEFLGKLRDIREEKVFLKKNL